MVLALRKRYRILRIQLFTPFLHSCLPAPLSLIGYRGHEVVVHKDRLVVSGRNYLHSARRERPQFGRAFASQANERIVA